MTNRVKFHSCHLENVSRCLIHITVFRLRTSCSHYPFVHCVRCSQKYNADIMVVLHKLTVRTDNVKGHFRGVHDHNGHFNFVWYGDLHGKGPQQVMKIR